MTAHSAYRTTALVLLLVALAVTCAACYPKADEYRVIATAQLTEYEPGVGWTGEELWTFSDGTIIEGVAWDNLDIAESHKVIPQVGAVYTIYESDDGLYTVMLKEATDDHQE